MAVRNYLHKTKLIELASKMEADGWMNLPTCGEYEVLRMKKEGRLVLVFDNHRAEHLSIMDNDFPLIKKYMEAPLQ